MFTMPILLADLLEDSMTGNWWKQGDVVVFCPCASNAEHLVTDREERCGLKSVLEEKERVYSIFWMIFFYVDFM